ncbi:MAG: hypothetical protein NTX64_09970 [Elusimicrobia bacterium]|nr:hypothetical protein [Elusimicrobiota bacterium]
MGRTRAALLTAGLLVLAAGAGLELIPRLRPRPPVPAPPAVAAPAPAPARPIKPPSPGSGPPSPAAKRPRPAPKKPSEPPPAPAPAPPPQPSAPPPAPVEEPAEKPAFTPAVLSQILVKSAPPEAEAVKPDGAPDPSALQRPDAPTSPSFRDALRFLPRYALYFSYTTIRDHFGVLCRTEACGRKVRGFENVAIAEGQRVLDRDFDQNAAPMKRYQVIVKATKAVEKSLSSDLEQYKADCSQAGECQ